MTQSLTYIEIDIPFCALTYGVGPCTASLGVTGDIKCFNSIKTCQDRANFDEGEVTLRFARPAEYLPRAIDCIPSIVSVDFSPATVSLGGNLGQRASLVVKFRDHPHADTGAGYDKYRTERDYDPAKQGSYWGKFRARQPFLRGRALRWKVGKVGDALADMESRRFVIESFTGPTPAGEFTITAKDVFKLADGDRAQMPALSTGFLAADIDASQTSASLLPSGVGNDEYPVGGTDYLCIGGNEIVQFSRVGDSLTIARGQLGTTARAHKAQDRVQVVKHYDGVDPAEILYDLWVNGADFDPAELPLADWQAETAAHLGNVYTATICEPTAVKTLSDELIEQAALAVWDDNLAAQVRLQVLRAIVTNVDTFTPETFLKGSLQVKEQPEKRISQVQVYFGQIDPTKPLSNLDNFRSSSLSIDEDAEQDYGSAAIKTITSRWIPQAGRSIADRLGAVILGRYRDAPRQLQFQLQRYAGTDVELGIGYRLEAVSLQDATGAPADIAFQVTRLNPGPAFYSVEAEEMLWTAPATDTGVRYVIFDASRNNINLRTEHDSIYAPAQSGDVVNAIVNAGVIIGSSSNVVPAFDVGSWASGVIINVTVIGRIQGKGGNGGEGADTLNGSTAEGGGPALYTRFAINLLDIGSGGQIWGGGGGGGGGGGANRPGVGISAGGGGGGGGGAGSNPGAPGPAGTGPFGSGAAGGGGTATAGGAGGGPETGISPFYVPGGTGGAGGGPGLAGAAGSAFGDAGAGGGGAAGYAIDGVSYLNLNLGAGDIRGAQVN